MECEQMEKVSQLIDGELSDEEATATMSHIANCLICGRACGDFTLLRRKIKLYHIQLEPFVKERVLRDLIASENPPLWKRRITIPVPVLALFLVAIVAVAFWGSVRLSQTPIRQELNVKRITTDGQSQAAFDLSRFDHGDRAAIEKIKQSSGSVNQ